MAINIMNTFKPMSDIETIHYSLIIPNKNNYFEINNIDELAASIREKGLSHNLEVMRNDDGTFTLISGERRYTALTKLINEGYTKFEYINCRVVSFNSQDEQDESIIILNSQARQLSMYEILQSVIILKKVYRNKLDKKLITGKVRDHLVSGLNLSSGTIATYEKIANNCSNYLLDRIRTNDITLSEASKLSELPIDEQSSIKVKKVKYIDEYIVNYQNIFDNKFTAKTKITDTSITIKFKDKKLLEELLSKLEEV